MNDKLVNKVSDDIKAYLNEIAERLWSGHAAVMIGAGFSKNAKSNNPLSQGFPNWNELGNIFYEKIHGFPPDNKEHYLNVLKLADEVEAAFGRPTLDQLIRSQVPDKEYKPSTLHTKLLQLPWTDVFTTNYDTLLERACSTITSQRFDVVVNKEDLVYSKQPRIIKLHGSFPSERPFIITEEDYRKYPSEFAPFVNTVQQSLLENTLCLIGFSGDDPNFLQWIGWIRDNLGEKNAPKIYLIGFFKKMSDAKKKLLAKCNIVLIDLSHCLGIGDDYAEALDIFLEYLISRKQDTKFWWPGDRLHLFLDSQKDILIHIQETFERWKNQRKSFPNWVIVPKDCRERLWADTKKWIGSKTFPDGLKQPLDINFLYELNWRLEKCLCPILNNLIEKYESIIGQYNPFPNSHLSGLESATIFRGNTIFDALPWDEIQVKWLELNISLMRFYREEGFLDKWTTIEKRIQELKRYLSPELNAKYNYERCLQAIFSLNILQIHSILNEWSPNENLPFWEAKRAGIIAELGNLNDAEKKLEDSLIFIRSQLNLSPVLSDYTWVSQEAYVMFLLQYVKLALKLEQVNNDELEENRRKFNERWNSLKQFKCDPWSELNFFEAYLEHMQIDKTEEVEKKEFDIDKVTLHFSFASEDMELMKAYNFLRYSEEIGLPFKISGATIGKKVVEGAIKRISKYSPYWSLVTLLRTGDSKIVDSIFNRESIAKMQTDQIDRLILEYIKTLQDAKSEIEIGDKCNNENFYTKIAGIIPEILSRLSVKCSMDAGNKILSLLEEVYKSEYKKNYNKISSLMKRLINSWPLYYQYIKIPDLLRIPILGTTRSSVHLDFPDPFYFLYNFTYKKTTKSKTISVDNYVVEQLINMVRSIDNEERERAVSRLVTLFHFGFLNQAQEMLFGDALWFQVDDKTKFPTNTRFYYFAFLTLPHPEHIDPWGLFKIYIKNSKFPIEKLKDTDEIDINGDNIPLCFEIIGGTKRLLSESGIDWSEDEAKELFCRILEWWDLDKSYLQKNHLAKEFIERFYNLVNMLTFVIIPRLSPETDACIKEQLLRLLDELNQYGVPSSSAISISIIVFPEKITDIYKVLQDSIFSTDEVKIQDAYKGIFNLLTLYKLGKVTDLPMYIWDLIAQPIKWRRIQGLVPAIKIAEEIINKIKDITPQEFLHDILVGLEFLINETSQDQSYFSNFMDRLECRSSAASLAYTLYTFYQSKNLEIPEVILKWKNICLSPEEFSEVRNNWIIEDEQL